MMDLSNIQQLLVTFFVTFLVTFVVLGKKASSLTLETKDVVIYKEDDSIILNCTYFKEKDKTEEISDRNIKWKKYNGTTFNDVATFSPPGGAEPFIEKDMKSFYINRTELIKPDSYLAAVIIINKPVCSDEGRYQCWIQYYLDESTKVVTSDSKVTYKAPTKAKEPIEFRVFPKTVEENHSITLICNADVGNPRGNIDIWKISQSFNTSDKLVYTSNSTNSNAESCITMEYANVTLPVTRGDNGVLFRCSSQNNFTKDQTPTRVSTEITVKYGPDKPTITMTPLKPMYYVGDSLTIQCFTKSNPPPVFTWSFRPDNKSKEIHNSNNDNKLVFDSLQTKDAGTYICTVINTARPNYPNMTSFVPVYVNNSERIKSLSVCDQCGYIETCQQSGEKTVCAVNIWMPIAVVCILLSTAFAVSSTVMIMQRKRTQESIATNNILIENRAPLSDATPENVEIHGGYISPEDLEFGDLQATVTQEGKVAAYSRL